MKLYYSPGSCSLAPHIVLKESGVAHELVPVDIRTKTYHGGHDFKTVTPKGYVPVLGLDDGSVLTEGAVIMQYIADQKPGSGLMPPPGKMDHYRAQEWLNFIASEIHKGFSPLWSPVTPEEVKTSTRERLFQRFAYLEDSLKGRKYLMGEQFTVCDAYLFTILNWSNFLKIDMSPWPVLVQYMARVAERPKVQEAMRAEKILK